MKKSISIIIIFFVLFMMTITSKASTGNATTDVRMRQGPSTGTAVITMLNSGEKVEVTGEENGWYKIKRGDTEGYVKKDYLKIEEDNTQTEHNTNNDGEKNQNINDTEQAKISLKTDTSVYVLPLFNSTKIADISKEKEIKLISYTGKWVYISAENITGWVVSTKVEGIEKAVQTSKEQKQSNTNLSENTVASNTVKQNDEANNDQSNNDQSNKDNVDQNKDQTSEQQQTSGDNQSTNENKDVNNKASDENVDNNQNQQSNEQTSSETSFPKTMYVNASSLNVRQKATINSDAITGLVNNQSVKVTGQEGDWYKVSTEDGEGYVLAKYLSDSKN